MLTLVVKLNVHLLILLHYTVMLDVHTLKLFKHVFLVYRRLHLLHKNCSDDYLKFTYQFVDFIVDLVKNVPVKRFLVFLHKPKALSFLCIRFFSDFC